MEGRAGGRRREERLARGKSRGGIGDGEEGKCEERGERGRGHENGEGKGRVTTKIC